MLPIKFSTSREVILLYGNPEGKISLGGILGVGGEDIKTYRRIKEIRHEDMD